MSADTLAAGRAAREAALDLFQQSPNKAEVLQRLRAAALETWRLYRHPVSSNDIRPTLVGSGYEGDPRILGAVFRHGWTPVGWTQVRGSAAHARHIRTFIPQGESYDV